MTKNVNMLRANHLSAPHGFVSVEGFVIISPTIHKPELIIIKLNEK